MLVCLFFQHRSTFFINLISFLKWFPIQLTFSATISINASTVAQTTVSCLRNAHARLLLQGPPDMGTVPSLTLARHLFLIQFLEHLFSPKDRLLDEHVPQKIPKMEPQNEFFENCAICVSIEPARANSISGLPKSASNSLKKQRCSKSTVFYTKIDTYSKNDLQNVSKWVTLFWWWRLSGHLWSPNPFLPKKE